MPKSAGRSVGELNSCSGRIRFEYMQTGKTIAMTLESIREA